MFDNIVVIKNTPGTGDGQSLKLICPHCKSKTNHKVLSSVTHDWDLNDGEMQGYFKMLIVECAGCESVQFCKLSSDTETFEEITGKDGKPSLSYSEKTEQFPPIDMDLFRRPRNFSSIPKEVKEAYEETYQALSNDMPKLAAAGARIIIELVCLAHKIQDGTLKEKIDKLKKKDYITQSMKIMLHNVRLFGNRHLHTTKSPDFFELSAAWDAVNNLLIAIYGTSDTNQHYEFSNEIKNKPAF